jgi:transposase
MPSSTISRPAIRKKDGKVHRYWRLELDEAHVNKDRLYRVLDALLAHKAAIEAHLSRRSGELFAIENDVLLYDVTSTYFEGQAEANALAERGYSRDHRADCKQVLIALVVTFDG